MTVTKALAPQNIWLRHDWRHSVFAPKLRCVQALTKNGHTASGAADSRHDAFVKCLGETAEIIAIKAASITSSEGVAAGPDIDFASYKALCERIERWAISMWWDGNALAKRVPYSDCQHLGVIDLVEALRAGATARRQTGLWMLDGFNTLEVAISVSTDIDGSRPILGFGADICPASAANSATLEMLMMEFNLSENNPNTSIAPYFKRLLVRKEALLPQVTSVPKATISLSIPEKLAKLTTGLKCTPETRFTLSNLTSETTGLCVARATISGVPSLAGRDDHASPLL